MPTNYVPTTAEAKDWLNVVGHSADDAKIALAITAASNEFQDATGVDPASADAGLGEIKVALLERVGNLFGFRGDDQVGPSTWFVDTIRRMHNPNGVS